MSHAELLSAIQTIDAGLRRLFHSIPQHLTCNIMPIDAYSLSDSHRESDTNGHRPSMDSDSRPSLAPPPVDISDGSPPGQVDIQQIRLAQHFVMVFCKLSFSLPGESKLTFLESTFIDRASCRFWQKAATCSR